MANKIFIDCGTNLCQGLEKIYSLNQMNSDWLVYSFEANPITYNAVDHNKFPHVKFINKAVWTENVQKYLSIEQWPLKVDDQNGGNNLINKNLENQWIGGGSNIMGENFKFIYSPASFVKRNEIKVECIDFCDFLKQNTTQNDAIIIKFDIEGAEYQVLEKMIKNNLLKNIKKIYIEWHNHMLNNKFNQGLIIEEIEKNKIELINWS